MLKYSIAVSTLAIALLSGQAQANPEKIVFAIGGSPQSLQGQTAQEFIHQLEQRLGDNLQVEYYDSGQLGDERQLIQRLRLGTVDLAAISSIMSSVSPDFALFDLPYLVKDRDHLKRIDEEIVMIDLADSVEQRGLKIISTWENGFRQITNSSRAITTPDDLDGLRIRTPQSDWRTRMFSTWGQTQHPWHSQKFSWAYKPVSSMVKKTRSAISTVLAYTRYKSIYRFPITFIPLFG